MGQCCSNPHFIVGEEFILGLLRQKAFFLGTYDYTNFLNELCSIRTEQSITKKNLEQHLIPKLYDISISKDQSRYYECLMNYILNQVKASNNLYEVLILFYPFLNHTDEEIEENLYLTFKYIVGSNLTLEKFEEIILKYIHFSTKGITYAFWKDCPDNDLIKALDILNTEIFTDEAIKRFIKEVIDLIQRKGNIKKGDVLTFKAFELICKKWDLAQIDGIRNIFIAKF